MSHPQTLICLEICVESHRVEEAIGQAFVMGASGVEVRDADTGHISDTVTVLSWHSGDGQALVQQVRDALGSGCVVRSRAADMETWHADQAEVRYDSEYLVITGAEHSAIDERPHLKLLSDVGFGGGSHETTRLGLMALESMMTRGRLGRVVDYGTGTGILALAAARLGAREVVGIDIDQVAVDTARLNIEANDLADIVTVGLPGVESGLFEVVIANLYLGVLVNHLEYLAQMMTADGICCITGFTLEHKSIIESTGAEYNLRLVEEIQQGPWLLLCMERVLEERESL